MEFLRKYALPKIFLIERSIEPLEVVLWCGGVHLMYLYVSVR